MTASLRSDEHLTRWFNPFEGDKDGPEVMVPPRVVRTRKKHECSADMDRHVMPVGTRAVVYRFLDNGKWRGFYCCETCIDNWLTECGIDPDLAAAEGST